MLLGGSHPPRPGPGGGPKKLRSRVADLKQAYKQLPSSLAHKALGVVAVKAPEGGGLL